MSASVIESLHSYTAEYAKPVKFLTVIDVVDDHHDTAVAFDQ
jgi:hypothetical protein